MTPRARVLLVSAPDGIATTLVSVLLSTGHQPVLATDFNTGKAVLASDRPDLLITDLKLGAYNGLHLAIRAGAQDTPSIVIGHPDPVLQADAERQKAAYVTTPVNIANLLAIADRVLEASRRTRKSQRTRVFGLEAFMDDLRVTVVDVSYEGIRLEAQVAEQHQRVVPDSFTLRVPKFDLNCRMHRIWTAPVMPTSSSKAVVRCGATVELQDPRQVSDWRLVVDALQPLAVSNR